MSTTLPAPLDALAPARATGASAGAPLPVDERARTYLVKTLGCQMNVHDSEHMAGMLEQAGYVPAAPADAAAEDVDVLVINTCAVRENASDKLYGNLGRLAGTKRARPGGMQIAVGGCLAQKDRAGIVERAPWVDVVFGTHNLDVLPTLLERARHNEAAQVEIAESLQVFPSTLPTRRESVYAGWVSISVGCNNTCTFCIVPHLRGKERDRRPADVLAEVEALVATGAIEVTLLGQNVNSYGVGFGDRHAFGKLLRAVGAVPGLERVRFTSPHPAAFTDDVIAAMADTPTVMPQLHMPLQSGSDRVLRAMRRSYRADRFLGILDRVRAAIPQAAITTDVIVGFPGETEDDFAQTLDVVERSRFASAYTFQYSPRPGTPAADLPGQVPKAVVQERYERLAALQERISGEENAAQVGRTLDVLVAQGEGRKDGATARISGRAQDNRLVHLALPAGLGPTDAPRPGDLVTVEVTRSAPYHLVADSALVPGGTFRVRRTRAGDAWQARAEGHDEHAGTGAGGGCGTGAAAPAGPVVLGLPRLGRPPGS
ncbi:tRNA (N6-isopentenyl adenosine(37)-C2)-methylthiotransferase MiaB [Cellulomonas sp. S1-8]|uniref:tRNA (N6-isopentenyl adenosine(37)-C2)-methylthiotransferase MiaB n=1 Tax=Cellulomonas sp. S1-8 TaxID=2904790 RepID=UPI0022446051|nr:tRNA (N6-isopentenyl adenosine(37)-C2)-methylthiotransferase MiaB [Cellulomonas sp. S1-8]UZN04907.1 tRNA (N6-isopentenyl adenosine(37)-C2)-methylthiotransferase MiaB [Cellulomonas sp. S1-8]